MSAAIVNVILGCEIPGPIENLIRNYDNEFDDTGFTSLYSASGEYPHYAGVNLFEFSYETISMDDLIRHSTPTADQIKKAKADLAKVRACLKDKFEEYEYDDENEKNKAMKLIELVPVEPKLLLLWSDS